MLRLIGGPEEHIGTRACTTIIGIHVGTFGENYFKDQYYWPEKLQYIPNIININYSAHCFVLRRTRTLGKHRPEKLLSDSWQELVRSQLPTNVSCKGWECSLVSKTM